MHAFVNGDRSSQPEIRWIAVGLERAGVTANLTAKTGGGISIKLSRWSVLRDVANDDQ